MRFNKNKSGQAAIEFLMTYGWMLLVVLIVGALIFSFVDFGSLLPNKIDISSPNIEPIVGDSFARGSGTNDGEVLVAIKYNGVRPIELPYNDTGQYSVFYNYGDTNCTNVSRIYNNDVSEEATTGGDIVRFRTGHSGYISFESCSDFDQIDVIEGEIKMVYISTQTGASTPVYGTIRLNKQ